MTFVERGVGDVLLAWENEAFLAQREFGKDKFEIVAPPLSILAEPPVAIVDKVADKKGTQAVAEAYLKYWYTKEGQEIAARNSYRPRDPEIAKEYEKSFAKVRLFTIDDVFGGWTKTDKDSSRGVGFDQISPLSGRRPAVAEAGVCEHSGRAAEQLAGVRGGS